MKEGFRRGGDGAARKECRFQLGKEGGNRGMWLLVRGGGREVDISAEAENFESLQRKTSAQSVIRRCSRIFCTASHTVGDNKLCVIYLIFHLDLNYIKGSQQKWTVFELLELLFAVNMQLYVCHKRIGIIQGSFEHFTH